MIASLRHGGIVVCESFPLVLKPKDAKIFSAEFYLYLLTFLLNSFAKFVQFA